MLHALLSLLRAPCPQAVTHYNDPAILAEVSSDLGEAMVGIDCRCVAGRRDARARAHARSPPPATMHARCHLLP